tara:strand:+ start:659 stop:943 length:285 start_codon:yes stop_codon:yes gene_type:complete
MKKGEKQKLVFDFKWGLKGLKISLGFIILIKIVLIGFLLQSRSLREILELIWKTPRSSLDQLAVFGGVLIFIAIPFLTGIHIGLGIHRKMKKSK